MEEKQMFKVQTEDGVVRDAELIGVFEYKETGKEYAIYSIAGANDMQNIFGGILIKDENGDDMLKDLETEEEKQMIASIIDGIIASEEEIQS